MRYTYHMNFQAYKCAVRAYVRSSPARRFWFHFQMWGMLTIGLALFFSIAISGVDGRFAAIAGPIGAGLIAGGLVAAIIRPWQLRRCYRASCGEIGDRIIFLEIDGSELRSGIDGMSEGRYQRNAICSTTEDDSTLLLFLNKKKFLYFSKSMVPPTAVADIRAWINKSGASDSC